MTKGRSHLHIFLNNGQLFEYFHSFSLNDDNYASGHPSMIDHKVMIVPQLNELFFDKDKSMRCGSILEPKDRGNVKVREFILKGHLGMRVHLVMITKHLFTLFILHFISSSMLFNLLPNFCTKVDVP